MTHSQRVERRREIARKVHDGRTIGEVAGEYGVSMTMVRNACTEFYPGMFPNTGSPPPSKTVKIILQLQKGDMTFQEIANSNGVSYQRVQRLNEELIEEGWPFDHISRNSVIKN